MAHPSQSSQHSHAVPLGKDSLVSDHGFDVVELRFLALSRRLFEAMSMQEQDIWAAAYRLAEVQHGANGPERILSYTIDVIEALRALRSAPFTYSRDGCKQCRKLLSQEERLMMATLHDLRRGKRSRAYGHAMLLCEGRDPARLLVAMEMLDFALFESADHI